MEEEEKEMRIEERDETYPGGNYEEEREGVEVKVR